MKATSLLKLQFMQLITYLLMVFAIYAGNGV